MHIKFSVVVVEGQVVLVIIGSVVVVVVVVLDVLVVVVVVLALMVLEVVEVVVVVIVVVVVVVVGVVVVVVEGVARSRVRSQLLRIGLVVKLKISQIRSFNNLTQTESSLAKIRKLLGSTSTIGVIALEIILYTNF